MSRLSNLLFVVLAVVVFINVSANNVAYIVTFLPCIQGSTCPQGNPSNFNASFALNGTISPNLTLNVGDQLQFYLIVNVSIHPLLICQNSPVPSFCQGASNSSQLNSPITQAGTNISVTFTTAGIYYYGCFHHPGMGATINVTQTGGSGNGQKLSASFLFISLISLLTIIFI
jgi:hypothetical protein